VGDSPFTTTDTHPDVILRDDIEMDLRFSRRRLDHIIARLKETVDLMRDIPRSKTLKHGFTEADVSVMAQAITRLEGVSGALVAAGF
jgi:hypothetical protein